MTSLSGESIEPDPFAQLRRWLDEAADSEPMDAAAMSLATATADGKPSVRLVLLRGFDERGLRFFTSFSSRKAAELEANPRAAVALYWPKLERQVRVEGNVTQLSDEESDAYFAARPRGHQIAAWSSEQSAPIEAREILDQRYEHFTQRFEAQDVPRPHSWGGYLLRPERFEFWQRRLNRMHDRIAYVRHTGRWSAERLQP